VPLRTVLRAMRVHQWTKNLFVFAPVIFAKAVGEFDLVLASIGAFFAMSLAASGCYLVNDLCDVEADRTHPSKRLRPIASGALSSQRARYLTAILFLMSGVVSVCLGWPSVLIIAIYVASTLAYSFWLKHVVLLELFIVASGFVLRVLMGSAATHLAASPWLLLTTLFLSLLLAFGKRRGELGRRGDEATSGRRVLDGYSLTFLDRCIDLLAGTALLCYAIYTTAEVTVQKMGTDWMIATTPFVAFGILRYLYVVEHGDHAADSPSELLLADRPLQLTLMMWLTTAMLMVY